MNPADIAVRLQIEARLRRELEQAKHDLDAVRDDLRHEAEQRYADALKLFGDFVLNGKIPPDSERLPQAEPGSRPAKKPA